MVIGVLYIVELFSSACKTCFQMLIFENEVKRSELSWGYGRKMSVGASKTNSQYSVNIGVLGASGYTGSEEIIKGLPKNLKIVDLSAV
ncbi:hypothetical protein C5167_014523 [Papaver somniferum]|uniref:Semialdehyde dehydrogenase NAD-binding domain-containing protein n=1 Tax=Papaver somniferum TaxID=3469 RepID=A0A4Y7J4C9_PAPSO|nr:hypothetical protein C5167_014523 [Papaver somniferum]